MAVTQTAGIAKVRLRLQDRTTRRDGTAISTPRFSDTDISTALNDAIRERQPLIQTLDASFYLTVLDFVGVTDAIAASSSTTLPIVAGQQYDLPSGFKELVRLARRDITNFPTVRLVPYSAQDTIYSNGGNLFASTAEDVVTSETVSFVTSSVTTSTKNRIRIVPAPASSSYTYRLFYIRLPVAPAVSSDTLDFPSPFLEIITLDAAIELAASVGDPMAQTLVVQRDAAIAARMDDPGSRNAGRRLIQDVRL